jgi:hypothetical protein
VSEQDVADRFGINVYAFDARYEIAAIALEEDTVLSPVVIFVIRVPCVLELRVGSGFWIEDEANAISPRVRWERNL